MSGHVFAAALALTAGMGWVALRAAVRTVRLLRWQNRDARSSWWGVL